MSNLDLEKRSVTILKRKGLFDQWKNELLHTIQDEGIVVKFRNRVQSIIEESGSLDKLISFTTTDWDRSKKSLALAQIQTIVSRSTLFTELENEIDQLLKKDCPSVQNLINHIHSLVLAELELIQNVPRAPVMPQEEKPNLPIKQEEFDIGDFVQIKKERKPAQNTIKKEKIQSRKSQLPKTTKPGLIKSTGGPIVASINTANPANILPSAPTPSNVTAEENEKPMDIDIKEEKKK